MPESVPHSGRKKAAASKSTKKDAVRNQDLPDKGSFFRDEEVFRYLKTTLFPKLIKGKAPGDQLRIWIPACSNGVEVYSMAMLLIELLGSKASKDKVRIFASDLSGQVIKKARTGEYSKQEVHAVSPERLKKFFTEVEGHYRIKKSLKEICSFARYNILTDPPFSQMDFISCRNMLAYFDSDARKYLFTIFHDALKEDGCLMLGNSDALGSSPLFSEISRKYKIFSPQTAGRRRPVLNSANQANHVDPDNISGKKEFQILNGAEEPSKEDIASANEELTASNQELKKRNDQLEETHSFSESVIAAMHEPMLILDKDFIVKSANKSFYKTFQVNSAETAGNSLFNLGDGQWDIQELRVMLNNLLEKDEDFKDFEVSHNFPGIGHKIMLLNGQKIARQTHSQQLILIAIVDITERTMAYLKEKELLTMNIQAHKIDKEELERAVMRRTIQLQQKNTELETLFQHACMGIILVNSAGVIVKINPRAEEKFGYEKDKLIGKKIETLIPKRFAENHDGHREKYSQNPHAREMGAQTNLLGLKKDGTEFPVEVSLSPYTTSKGLFVVAFVVDITTRKKTETIIKERTKALEVSYETLKAKNETLRKLNKELETFTFISSHDLQEPLRKIQNFVLMLLQSEKKQLSAEGRSYLQGAFKSAKRLQMLIEDLLAYSRIKNAERKFEKVDLTRVAMDVIADIRPDISKKDTIVRTQQLCTLNILPFQFHQLFKNLISNSLKFSDPKRRLRIAIKCDAKPSHKLNDLNLSPDKKYCHITYTDNGIGFDPIYKDRIFEVFQRLHPVDKYKGSGIGLAICRRIVENHEGIITATGEPDKGARFDIYIPAD